MADWLLNGARKLELTEATIDILNQTIVPSELNLHPLLINLKDLKLIIEKGLKINGFPMDFITDAKIRVEFSNLNTHNQKLYCFPTLTDKEGHKYESVRIIEEAYEDKFDPFDKKNIFPNRQFSFINKVKSLFN
jgi:hypothetical protein